MAKLEIEIPEEELTVLRKRVDEKKDFNDVQAYVQDIVSQVAKKLQEEQGDDDDLSKEDEEKVKQRLRDLGYLD